MPLTAPTTSAFPLSIFFSYQQFINRYGLKNVVTASNKDNTAQTNTNTVAIGAGQPNWFAVQDAFNYATDEVQAQMRGGVVQVPFDFSPNNNVVPPRVGRWAMQIAFSDLYDVRGWDDKNTKGNKQSNALARIYDDIRNVRAGVIQMWEAVQAADINPQAVTPADVRAAYALASFRWVDGVPVFSWNSAGASTPFWNFA